MNFVKAEKIELGTFRLDMAAIHHFWFDLTFVKLKHSRRNPVQGTDQFSSIFSKGMYIYEFHLRPQVNWCPIEHLGASMKIQLLIITGGNSGFAQ